jgi:hypothetical protein
VPERPIVRSFFVLSATAVLLGAVGSGSVAQEAVSLEPGTRVRVTAGDYERPVIGAVSPASAADTLRLTQGAAIPVSTIERLEISRGRKSRWVMGGVIGAAVGGGILAYSGSQTNEAFMSGPAAVLGGVAGGLLGFTAGALIGRSIRTERWVVHLLTR